jgi:hypothetical protein
MEKESSDEQFQHWERRIQALTMAVAITQTALGARIELDDNTIAMAQAFYEFLSTPLKD